MIHQGHHDLFIVLQMILDQLVELCLLLLALLHLLFFLN